MATAVGVLVFLAGALGAGGGWGTWWNPRSEGYVRVAVGVALTLALWTVGAWWLGFVRQLHAVSIWCGLVVLGGLLAGVLTSMRQDASKGGACENGSGRSRKVAAAVWLALALGGVVRAALVGSWTLPPGWDPSFHLLLASRVAETGGLLTSWQPYEPIRLNYPLAAHALLAGLQVGGLERAFSVFLGGGSTLLILLVAALARRAGAPDVAVVAAAILMSLGVWMGGLGYLGWGGLPNLLAVVQLCGLLVCVLTPELRWRGGFVVALLTAGIVLTHHHVMVSGGLAVLAALVATRRWDVLPWTAVGMTIASGGWVPLVLRAGDAGQTTIYSYVEELLTPPRLAEELGWPLAGSLLLTPLLLVGVGRRNGPARGLIAPLAALLVAWMAFDHGCRLLAWARGWEAFTVFTPSRFLTNAVPLLAVLGGCGIAELVRRRGVRAGWMVCGLTGLSVVTMLPRYRELWRIDPVPGPWLDAARWVSRHAPPDILVLNGMTVHPDARAWLSYLTRRPTTYTPIPTSEPVHQLPDADGKVATAREVWDLREAKWVRPDVHEVLYVSLGEENQRVAVSRIRTSQPSAPSISQP